MSQTVILAGGYGSGKSEIALNFVLQAKAAGRDMILADLDLVNPYFASRDITEELKLRGIQVTAPEGRFQFTDLPSVPKEMIGILQNDQDILIDLAGDENGSTVLGYLSRYVRLRTGYEHWMVVNPYRPFAADLTEMKELVAGLELVGKIPFTGIISNPNLLEETNLEVIRQGHRRVEEYSQAFQLPICRLCVEKSFYEVLFPEYGSLLMPLNLYLRPGYLNSNG